MHHTRSCKDKNLIPLNPNINKLQRRRPPRNQPNRVDKDPPNPPNPQNLNPQNRAPPGEHVQNNAPPPLQRVARCIGAGDEPNTHAQRHGIVPPAVANNNFEIKSSLISMIQNNKFHGLPVENPLEHLDEFDRLCGLTKINGVTEDAFKLRLFPFSLGDKAHRWEKNLPHGSITSWNDCKKAFLAKFLSPSRTAKLRNDISGFVQKNGETFSEAWERFKNYTTQCPHHGFSMESLLSTLYRGVQPSIKRQLDTASNGNFLNKDVQEGWELVENLAQSDGNYNEDHDRTQRGSIKSDEKHRKEMKALNEKLDKLLLAQQKQVHFVTEENEYLIQEGETDPSTEEIYYMQNLGGYTKAFDQVYPQQQHAPAKNFAPYPRQQYQGGYPQKQAYGAPPGFQSQTQSSGPPATEIDVKTMLQKVLQGQATGAMDVSKKFAEIHHKLDGTYNELNSKLEALNARVQFIESNRISTSAAKPTGQLPGKSVQNPKEYTHSISAITLRSGKALPDPKVQSSITEASNAQEGQELVSDEVSVEDEVPAENTTPIEELDRVRASETAQPTEAVKPPVSKEKESAFVPPPYKPPMPFPKIPEGCDSGKNKEVQGMVVLSHECSAIIQSKSIPKKLEDPGSFTLPCSIGPLSFSNSLCDLGASISLMPLSVAKKLGFTRYKACQISLILADRSVRIPHGILEDLPVRVGSVDVPTDFVVLEMDEEPKDPLILGDFLGYSWSCY
ncbi:unnamed protein product [Microthlaspi erraticum]|uniref:Retrotransposon gag domain-containing protein n=1 Tax=Microthlaspi erraticum TaxID=1685480 RepID=A0A6D2J2I6_9BRAS|nr:unnamed protein product [Microthlaspi erraticum]